MLITNIWLDVLSYVLCRHSYDEDELMYKLEANKSSEQGSFDSSVLWRYMPHFKVIGPQFFLAWLYIGCIIPTLSLYMMGEKYVVPY